MKNSLVIMGLEPLPLELRSDIAFIDNVKFFLAKVGWENSSLALSRQV